MNGNKITPAIEKLYTEAFPENERRPMQWFRLLLANEPAMHLVTYDDQAMLCYWHFSTFIYVEYLAVDASLRGQGKGGSIISELVAKNDVPVILEVEPPVDEITRRRVGFYMRMGFRLLPDRYMQPSYGVVPGIELRLMLAEKEEKMPLPPVAEMVRTIHERVYGVKNGEMWPLRHG